MTKQMVTVAVDISKGIVDQVRVSVDDKKLTKRVLEENAKAFGFVLTGDDNADYECLQKIAEDSNDEFHLYVTELEDVDERGEYVVVETFVPEHVSVCTIPETGKTLTFFNLQSATEYAETECQKGRVVKL